MNTTAIHEAGHFLMFLKEAIKCTTHLDNGTYYWTFDKFCDQALQLCILPNIKKGFGGFFSHHIPSHCKYNDVNVKLGGMAAVYALRNKNRNFTKINLWWYRFFEGCNGDIKAIKKKGIDNEEIVHMVNVLISNLNDKDEEFINKVVSEITKPRYSHFEFNSHPKGILYTQQLKILAYKYKNNKI